MNKYITGIYLSEIVDGKQIQISIEDCPERALCRWIWKMDDKALGKLINRCGYRLATPKNWSSDQFFGSKSLHYQKIVILIAVQKVDQLTVFLE